MNCISLSYKIKIKGNDFQVGGELLYKVHNEETNKDEYIGVKIKEITIKKGKIWVYFLTQKRFGILLNISDKEHVAEIQRDFFVEVPGEGE